MAGKQAKLGGLAWLPLVLLLPVHIAWSLAETPLVLDLSLLLPVLGAWLGATYGRAALAPLLIAAPVTLCVLNFLHPPVIVGAGPSILLLTIAAALTFARRDEDVPHTAPGWSTLGLVLLTVGITAFGVFANVSSFELSSETILTFNLALEPDAFVAAAVFLLVASGTVSASAAFLAAAVSFLVLILFGGQIDAALPRGSWDLGYLPHPFYGHASAEASWDGGPLRAIWAAAAALLGSAIRPFWRQAGMRPSVSARTALLLFAAAGLTLFAPHWIEAARGHDLYGDALNIPRYLSDQTPLMIVAGLAFAAGLSWPRGGLIVTPIVAQTFVIAAIWLNNSKFGGDPWDYSGAVLTYGITAWVFAWVAAIVVRHKTSPALRAASDRVVDVSALAQAVRRFDVSTTLRAFAAPIGIAVIWWWLAAELGKFLAKPANLETLGEHWETFALSATLWLVALLAPFDFVVADWMARRAWRPVSALIGAAIGGLGFMLFGIVFLFIWNGIDNGDAADLNELASYLLLRPGGTFLFAGLIGAVIGVTAFIAWLFARGANLELTLAGPAPRMLLIGDIRGRRIWARLAFLLGVPSSMWHAGAFAQPSFWLFMVARPLFYFSLAAAALALGVAIGPVMRAVEGVLTATYRIAGSLGLPPAMVVTGGAFFLLLASHFSFGLGKRLAARRIWDSESSAAPILFLRSFKDDRLDFRRPWHDLVGRWLDLWSFRRNADEVLIDEFAQYGPVIALGRPGEPAPPFGAQRRYTTDAEWQDVIADAARRARAIVVAAGDTAGLDWEYELIAREGLLDKTIILIPPARAGSGSTRMRLRRLAAAFPDAQLAEDFGAATPIAVLPANARASMLIARRPRAEAYLLAMRAFFQALPEG